MNQPRRVDASGHQHWPAGSTELSAAARQHLIGAGEQWTELRANVFDVVAEGGAPISAYDAADRLSQRSGRRIAVNSVYRILDLFVETNLVKRIESRNAYMASTHPGCVHDCIFLICEGCGHIDHIDDDRLAHAMRARAAGVGFAPHHAVLELTGLCARCGDQGH